MRLRAHALGDVAAVQMRSPVHSSSVSARAPSCPWNARRSKARPSIGLILFVSLLPVWVAAAAAAQQSHTIDQLRSVSTAARPANLYDGVIEETSTRCRVDSALIKAMIKVSSNFNPTFNDEPKGRLGLMGVPMGRSGAYNRDSCLAGITETQARDLSNPRINIDVGVSCLRKRLDSYNGNVRLALAAWQLGEDAVATAGGVPADPDVIDFISGVVSQPPGGRSGHRDLAPPLLMKSGLTRVRTI